ncbi:hypothetical protein Avbf_09288 [Armadillidium vulgare]|nr:hypothetical protein Avbf_09288 [Armadillidium vulgare]
MDQRGRYPGPHVSTTIQETGGWGSLSWSRWFRGFEKQVICEDRLVARGGIWERGRAGHYNVPGLGSGQKVSGDRVLRWPGAGRVLAGQPGCHSWITDGSRMMRGSIFVEAIKIRLAVSHTKERAVRGRPHLLQDKLCDLGCPRIESLGHILQECPVVARLRVQRHDSLNAVLRMALESRAFTVQLEPTIPTQAGIRRPDLVFWKGDQAWVVDTTVSADSHGTSMSLVFDRKCAYYNVPDIRYWVTERTGQERISFSAVVMNWRGDLAPRSLALLRMLGISRSIKLLEIRNMEGSAKMLRFFRAASGHWG